MCYHRPNGRIQGLFQAMAYQSGNIYRNDSISLFRCGLMLRNTCMYIIILDLCLNLLIWTPLVTNILELWVWEVFGMTLILNIKQLHINWEIFTRMIVPVSFVLALYILCISWMSIFLIFLLLFSGRILCIYVAGNICSRSLITFYCLCWSSCCILALW